MPTYVYACTEKEHPTQEVVHKMSEDPPIKCDKCGEEMHRKPQKTTWHFAPFDVLTGWCDENLGRYKARKRGQKAPHFSKDRVNMPGSGIPQKDFDTR